jgi:hypothetical protein
MPRLDPATRTIANSRLQAREFQNEVARTWMLTKTPFPGYGADSNKLVQRMTTKGVEDLT